ncbi:hypothetical protein GOV12_06950 [Candidatus Pacearchaeota archaeon]|nr:hypothetical protein [Candidatus Pacearchaeota archaeon]
MEGKQIGTVFNFFEKVGVIAIELTDKLKLGDTIRIVGGEKDFTEVISSMQVDGKSVETAKAGDQIGIRVSDRARKGYKVYKV